MVSNKVLLDYHLLSSLTIFMMKYVHFPDSPGILIVTGITVFCGKSSTSLCLFGTQLSPLVEFRGVCPGALEDRAQLAEWKKGDVIFVVP